MTSWLFTVYSVRTMITEIEAEDIEEAKKKIESRLEFLSKMYEAKKTRQANEETIAEDEETDEE